MMYMTRTERDYLVREMARTGTYAAGGGDARFEMGRLVGGGKALATMGGIIAGHMRIIGAKSACGVGVVGACLAAAGAQGRGTSWFAVDGTGTRPAVEGRPRTPVLVIAGTITTGRREMGLVKSLQKKGIRCAGIACGIFMGDRGDVGRIKRAFNLAWMFDAADAAAELTRLSSRRGRSSAKRSACLTPSKVPRGRRG